MVVSMIKSLRWTLLCPEGNIVKIMFNERSFTDAELALPNSDIDGLYIIGEFLILLCFNK